MTYANRRAAGEQLAQYLTGYAGRPDTVVLGLVRGGVPVAAEVADVLGLPLDVLVIRKLGVPWAPEVAFGAIGPGGVVVHNSRVENNLSTADISAVVAAESATLSARESRFRAGRPPLVLADQVAIIVDDGWATGATARAAVLVARDMDARTVVVAAPVGAADSVALLRAEADEVVCPLVPAGFAAVGQFYDAFPQTSDDEVLAALAG